MNDQTIYLVGYRCTGKSAVGRHLAHQLHWAYCDTDELVKQNLDRTIKAFFDERGEEAFRDLEQEMLREASTLPEVVISTGGGMVERSDNRDLMSSRGTVIWLRAEPETIRDRMQDDEDTEENRPALSGNSAVDEIEEVLERRQDLYDDAADYSISTDDHPPKSLAEFILDELQSEDE